MSLMSGFANVQQLVFLLLVIAAFVFQLVAFIDALRFKDEVYRAAGKANKTAWTVGLGICVLLGFIALPPLGVRIPFASLIGVVAAGVYMVDVRKALRAVDPRYRGRL